MEEEAAAPQRILNESEIAYKEYLKRLEKAKKTTLVNRERPITMEEVQQHTTPENGIWFVIDGKVYDATPWLKDHPGGPEILIKSSGKDVSRVFKITNHSSFAVEEASNYQIGVLAPSNKL